MTFGIGRGFAEVQILNNNNNKKKKKKKKVKLNRLEYFDKILQTH